MSYGPIFEDRDDPHDSEAFTHAAVMTGRIDGLRGLCRWPKATLIDVDFAQSQCPRRLHSTKIFRGMRVRKLGDIGKLGIDVRPA